MTPNKGLTGHCWHHGRLWLSAAQKAEVDLGARDVVVERVPVDVDAVADWCRRQGRPFNGAARAEFVTEAMRKWTLKP